MGHTLKSCHNSNSCPLKDIKAREKLNASICLSSITKKDEGFVFKGCNSELILERVSLFVLGSPSQVGQRTTSP